MVMDKGDVKLLREMDFIVRSMISRYHIQLELSIVKSKFLISNLSTNKIFLNKFRKITVLVHFEPTTVFITFIDIFLYDDN